MMCMDYSHSGRSDTTSASESTILLDISTYIWWKSREKPVLMVLWWLKEKGNPSKAENGCTLIRQWGKIKNVMIPITFRKRCNVYLSIVSSILFSLFWLNLTIQQNWYSEIYCVFRMWQNLMALKWGGQGHDPAGIDATSNRELTVECPACPHPGCNLPDGWENAGALLYIFLCICFSFIILIIHNTDSYILSSSPLTATSNSKGRNGVSNSCLVGGLIVQKKSTNPILLTMSTRKRFVSSLYSYTLDLFLFSRLIHVNLSMMPWFVWLLDQHQGMQSPELWSSYAQDTAWYAEMEQETFS